MALIALTFGYTPADYWALTQEERNALVRVANRARPR